MNTSVKRPRIGITLGDPNGIGPEITIKALADSKIAHYITPVVYGSRQVLSFYTKKIAQCASQEYTKIISQKAYELVECHEKSLDIVPGKPSREAANVALSFLRQGFQDTCNGYIDGLVTGPIDKNLTYSSDFPHRGHTEYLTKECNAKESIMIMIANNVRIGLVTEHIPLADITALITKDRVMSKIRLMRKTLLEDFKIANPKMALLGVNPHAGDGGLLGKEEEYIIKPIVKNEPNVDGPFAADSFFASKLYANYDGILAMYHDQGLLPFKTLFFDTGVNYTAGLPIVRTSPDHGPAYAISGHNVANENSLKASIYLAREIVIRKKRNKMCAVTSAQQLDYQNFSDQ